MKNRSIVAGLATLTAVLLSGCEESGDTINNTTNSSTSNYPPDIVQTNEAIPAIIIAQDGSGNYVQVNVQTGEILPVQIGQVGTNNVVLVDITQPPPPPPVVVATPPAAQ